MWYAEFIVKNADKEGAVRRGFSESPAAAFSGRRCERGIPKYSAHRLWVRPIHGGTLPLQSGMRYTFRNISNNITMSVWIWVESREKSSLSPNRIKGFFVTIINITVTICYRPIIIRYHRGYNSEQPLKFMIYSAIIWITLNKDWGFTYEKAAVLRNFTCDLQDLHA